MSLKRSGLMSVLVVLCGLSAVVEAQEDTRELIEFPAAMRAHMLGNMRNHLQVIHKIQQAMASDAWGKAADLAESGLGMSSLQAHGAEHMAPHMPAKMRDIGSKMHKNASKFAFVAQETAVDGDALRAVGALAKVTAQCVECHAAYRVR